jgi:hypothetical protein
MERVARTINYRQFYALLRQLSGANKEDLVRQFTDGRTDSLTAMRQEEYFSMLGAMEAMVKGDSARYAMLDKARKRLIACVGGYLVAMGRKNEIGLIKALACRASGCKNLNDIPLDRLNSLYNAFLHRQRDLKAVAELNPNAPLSELRQKLDAAIQAEQYELAARIQQRIDAMVNKK